MIEKIDFKKIEQARDILHDCRHKKRREIIQVVLNNPGIIASAIDKKIKLDQPTTAGHLGILRRAGVLKTNRNKKNVHYSVNIDIIQQISSLSNTIVETCEKAAQ